MDWLMFFGNILNRIPIERVLFPPRDNTKALEEFAATMTAPVAPKEASLEQKTAPTITREPETVPQQEDIATACVPCGVGHFAGAAKLLNEAFRFRDDGITSNQVLDDIAGAIGELNAMERVDLTPEKLQNTARWERPIADEALRESRKLRHRLESISSMEEIEKAAADTESYYKKLYRQWFKQRFAHLGPEKAQAIAEKVGRQDTSGSNPGSTDPKEIARKLGLTFDGMQNEYYQFTVVEGPEEAKDITFYVTDLSQVEARLKEKLKEFGIEILGGQSR